MSKLNSITEIYEQLPMKCATYDTNLSVVGLITKGIQGYVPMIDADIEFMRSFNQENGVDDAIKNAMEVGSILGWNHPDINPDLYRKAHDDYY
jgi:hypothetical protein